MTLWGLLFVLVLTMISGARKLMTPGAWEKKGATHQLVDEDKTKKLQERKDQLAKLKDALWRYADANAGKFPPSASEPSIAVGVWLVPYPTEARYLYVPGVRGNDKMPLAFEPELFGAERLVLCVDGEIRTMASDEIAKALPAEKR